MQQLPGYQTIWKISLPVIFSLFAQNIIAVTDSIFLSNVGIVEFDASAIGGIYYYILYMLGFGFTTGTQILIARRNGEKRYKQIGMLMENCWYFLLLGAALLIPISKYITPAILKSIVSSDNVLAATIEFIDYRIYGLFFAYIVASFRAFHVGTTKSSVLILDGLIMAVVNIFLAYGLIFGKFGFPEMGLKGAAIATVISEFVAMTFLILYNLNKKKRKTYLLFCFRKVNFKALGSMLSVSIYIMILYFISIGSWFAFFIIIEQSGERNLAISNIVRSIYSLILLPGWAYTATVSSLVSNAFGAGKVEYVIPIIRKVAKMGFITAACVSIIVVAVGHWLLIPYTLKDPSLVAASLPSLYVVALANIIFGITGIIFNGITGTGRTSVIMILETGVLVVYLFTAYLFVKAFPLNVEVAWCSELIYWLLIGVLSACYLKWGRWREVRI